jgi:hypothetical protein
MTNEQTPRAEETPVTPAADAAITATPEPEPVAIESEELGETEEDTYEPAQPSVIQMRRPVFLALAGVAVVAILALSAATAWLAIDRQGTDDPVVATVNGEQIRRSEYDRLVAHGQGPVVLDGLVTERLIAAEARRRNVTADDAEVQQLFDAQRSQFDSDEEWEGALVQAGLTEQELRRQIEISTLVRKMVADKAQVSDQEVDTAYTANADRYAGQPVDAAKQQVRQALVRQKEATAGRELIDEMRGSAKIEMHVPGKAS